MNKNEINLFSSTNKQSKKSNPTQEKKCIFFTTQLRTHKKIKYFSSNNKI